MYTYYIRVESEEHMLFTREIASLFGFYSLSDVPHFLLISKAIKKVLDESNNSDLVGSLFYKTKNNMKQVYPYEVYSKAVEYINNNSIAEDDVHMHIEIDGTTFRYKKL